MSKKPRPYKAGFELGKDLCELADILYLLDNARQFLTGLMDAIKPKLEHIKKKERLKE